VAIYNITSNDNSYMRNCRGSHWCAN